MAESQSRVPAYHQLLWPVLKALKSLGGSASNDELLSVVVDLESIPDAVLAVIHTDGRLSKLVYNLAWAKTYLKRVGAIVNSERGVWAITPNGEAMTEANCSDVPAQVRQQDQERRRARDKTFTQEPLDSSVGTAGEPVSKPRSWKDVLLETLRGMSPAGFERLAQRVLREAGFIKVEVLGRSGDGGIDGVGVLKVNLLSFRVLFQCKRYQGTVGAPAVRDFRGAMAGRSDKGLIITTGAFSTEASREATRDGAPAIDLIDGESLCDLLRGLSLGVRTEQVEQISVDPAWFAEI